MNGWGRWMVRGMGAALLVLGFLGAMPASAETPAGADTATVTGEAGHDDAHAADGHAVEAGDGHGDAEHAAAGDHGEGHGGGHPVHVPPTWLVVFFAAMLLAIAIFPLTPAHHWWEHNRNRAIVTAVISVVPLVYYLIHDVHSLEHTMLTEYIPFIVLLGSLFMIAGGIRLTGDLQATPEVNSAFIGIGALLASFIGTTGASMLLIRPVLQTNRERRQKVHTVVFFIFLVSNVGGCLLPIGDPPLFLGYLAGVPFFWTLGLWTAWLPTTLAILVIYWLLDRWYYRRETPAAQALDRTQIEPLRIHGAHNFLFLGGVVAAVIFMNQNASIPFLRIPFLREITMALMVVLSYLTTAKNIRKDNKFTLNPIIEVAVLFIGIFTTVIPALTLLKIHGAELGVDTAMKFFWATGSLSAFLDNAPTYFVFFKTASGMAASGGFDPATLVGTGIDRVPEHFLVAISLGSVFMGAMTYIGNGPNFMVKAIAEESGIRMPTFFGYMKWSLLVLLPVFLLMSVVFFLL